MGSAQIGIGGMEVLWTLLKIAVLIVGLLMGSRRRSTKLLWWIGIISIFSFLSEFRQWIFGKFEHSFAPTSSILSAYFYLMPVFGLIMLVIAIFAFKRVRKLEEADTRTRSTSAS